MFAVTEYCRKQQFEGGNRMATDLTVMSEDDLLFALGSPALALEESDLGIPFCRHVFLESAHWVLAGEVPIDTAPDMIQSGYHKRRDGELPVLSRWINASDLKSEDRVAEYLDVIVYSQEYLATVGEAIEAPWGIVAVKGQMRPYQTPPPPATLLRNALGKEYGGNGVPIDPEAYAEAVAHAEAWIQVRNDVLGLQAEPPLICCCCDPRCVSCRESGFAFNPFPGFGTWVPKPKHLTPKK